MCNQSLPWLFNHSEFCLVDLLFDTNLCLNFKCWHYMELATLRVSWLCKPNCLGLPLRVATQPMQGEETDPPELSGLRPCLQATLVLI